MIPELAKRLKDLMLRFDSDHDGEALNATRIFVKTLRKEGLTLHDLAERIIAPPKLDFPDPRTYRPKPKPQSKGLYTKEGFLRPWNQVIGEILERHETIPKRYGGKFLTAEQVRRIERIYRGELAAHDYESMLKRIDDRLREAMAARDAERKAA